MDKRSKECNRKPPSAFIPQLGSREREYFQDVWSVVMICGRLEQPFLTVLADLNEPGRVVELHGWKWNGNV